MKQARRTIDDALAQHTDDYRAVRELHRVSPHVTWEVRFERRRAVCKRATSAEGDPATEARVLSFVGRETDLPIPEVLAVGADHFVDTSETDAGEALQSLGGASVAQPAGRRNGDGDHGRAFPAHRCESGRRVEGKPGPPIPAARAQRCNDSSGVDSSPRGRAVSAVPAVE